MHVDVEGIGVSVEAVGEDVHVRPIDAAPQVREVREQLAAGELRVEREVAGDVSDVTADLDRSLVRVEPEDGGRPRGGTDLVEQRSDRRGLAGTVRSQEAVDLALLDVQIETGDGVLVAESAPQVASVDHGPSGAGCAGA